MILSVSREFSGSVEERKILSSVFTSSSEHLPVTLNSSSTDLHASDTKLIFNIHQNLTMSSNTERITPVAKGDGFDKNNQGNKRAGY